MYVRYKPVELYKLHKQFAQFLAIIFAQNTLMRHKKRH